MDGKILVTMDSPEQLELITSSLERLGLTVSKCATFHESMEILNGSEIDLIIADVHLQNGGSVLDFLRWTKCHPNMQATPFVCFSSERAGVNKFLWDGVRSATRALGAAKYIAMEHFDSYTFWQEIECLVMSRAGSDFAELFPSARAGKSKHMTRVEDGRIHLTNRYIGPFRSS